MLTDRQNEEPDLRRRGDPRGFTAAARPNPYAQVVTNSEHFSSTQGAWPRRDRLGRVS